MSIRPTPAYFPNVLYRSASRLRSNERESDPKTASDALPGSTISRSFPIPNKNQNEGVGPMPDAPSPDADARSEIAALLHEQFARLTRRLRTLELPPGMTAERLSA